MLRSIGTRIGIGYSVLVLTGILTGVVAITNFAELGTSVNSLFQQNYQGLIIAENMLKSIDKQENTLLSIMADESRYMDNAGLARITFKESRDQFLALFERASRSQVDIAKHRVLDSLMLAYRQFLIYADSLNDMAQDKLPITTLRTFQEVVIRPQSELLKDYCFRVLEINQAAITGIDEKVRRRTLESVYTIGGALLINLLFSIFSGIYFTRSIARPLRNLTRSVKRISEGSLYQKIDIHTGDEIGDLSGEFNKMTERLRAYDELNIQKMISEKKKSEAIVHSISDPVIVTDPDSRIVLLNGAADMITTGLFRSGWQQHPVTECIDDEHWRRLFAVDVPAAATSADLILPLTIGEEVRHFRPRQTIITNEAGRVSGLITLLQDVTRFKNLDELKSEFMATVSHELRTPLTSLNMMVDILRQEVVGTLNDRQQDLLRGGKFDCDRLIKLVGDLLNLSRLEAGKLEVKRQSVPIAQVIHQAMQPFRLSLEQHRLTLDVDILTTRPTCLGDTDQVFIILTNLLNNAVRHTPDGGRVVVMVEEMDGMIAFHVQDSGPGIPPKDLEHIFDRFVQLKDQDSATPGSVGLGLAIARKAVEVQGGRLWVESEFGRGSRFSFTLPADKEGLYEQ